MLIRLTRSSAHAARAPGAARPQMLARCFSARPLLLIRCRTQGLLPCALFSGSVMLVISVILVIPSPPCPPAAAHPTLGQGSTLRAFFLVQSFLSFWSFPSLPLCSLQRLTRGRMTEMTDFPDLGSSGSADAHPPAG